MENTKMAEELNSTITALYQLFSSFEAAQVNTVPFEGSWTAGELMKHVELSADGFVQMLQGPVKDTDRAPDEMVEKIRSIFLDFTTKMKSPDFIVPPKKVYNKDVLLKKLKEIQINAGNAVQTMDLTKTCTGFELPALGFLTKLEAASFIIYHTQRHTHQLSIIYQKLAEKSTT